MSKKQAKNIEFIQFQEEVTPKIVKEAKKTKASKSVSLKKEKENNSKKASKKEVMATKQTAKKSIETAKAQGKKAQKVEVKQPSLNPIKAFFADGELKAILTGKKNCSINLITDSVNKAIHKKALSAIIKANKSARKFNLEA